jgi:hypothetical protein
LIVRLARLAISFALVALPTFAQDKSADPPQALVTFYSSGNPWLGGLPGYKHGVFTGRLFDEYDELAFIWPGQFITFKLDAGPHTFSANSWMVHSPKGGGHLELDLVAGRHYYIATFFSQAAVVVPLPLLEKRSCEEAQKESAKAVPLRPKHLKHYAADRVVDETTFPACPPPPTVSQP